MNDHTAHLSAEDLMRIDLTRSGLNVKDIRAALLSPTERLVCELPPSFEGYVIPYWDLGGAPIGFYRVRIFDQQSKYRQLKDTPNHIYFPRDFLEVFRAQTFRPPIIFITEGEKKAALACKRGFPTVGLGGVDSWRNRMILLSRSTAESFKVYRGNKNLIAAHASESPEEYTSAYAVGFDDLCNFGIKYGCTMGIVFDTDSVRGTIPEVQRAAAALGHELRHRGFGIEEVRQITLPPIEGLLKVAMDDYLLAKEGGVPKFKQLITDNMLQPTTFPRMPNLRDYVLKRLSAPHIARRDMQNLSLSILTELDAAGRRMVHHDSGRYYYFENETSELMEARLNIPKREQLQDTSFGRLLYRDYGIVPAADGRLTQWLGAQYTAEAPISAVNPYKVLAHPADADYVCYQINNGQYIKIDGDPIEPFKIYDNGADNVLFESKSVVPIEAADLKRELHRQYSLPMNNWWHDVLDDVRLATRGNHQLLVSLLYYISPWLYRWKGTQLPVELITGEPGSGKSTLAELRLNIILGESALHPVPHDMKDWHASITSTGGIHVTDNVHMSNRDLKQQISDAICRLITEPNPHIEMRKFYTEADLMRIKVDPVFVFTAISKPFHNADLLQRAILLELDKTAGVEGADINTITEYDSRWMARHLDQHGGRIAWAAHHLLVLHKFLDAAKKHWNTKYQAKYRLINLEQILCILAEHVFKIDASWIPSHLSNSVEESVVASDTGLTGLCQYVDERIAQGFLSTKVGTREIVEWARSTDEFDRHDLLTNTRSLGRYMSSNKHAVASVAGLVDAGTQSNRQVYEIVPTSRHKRTQ